MLDSDYLQACILHGALLCTQQISAVHKVIYLMELDAWIKVSSLCLQFVRP